MTLWDFFAWVGIAALAVLLALFIHFCIETFIVTRIGWTRLDELGFWRAIPVAVFEGSDQ